MTGAPDPHPAPASGPAPTHSAFDLLDTRVQRQLYAIIAEA